MQVRSGYSLFELLVTVSLLTLLVTTGTPFLRNSIRASRLTAEVNSLVRAVHIARSEAVKRNGQSVVCPTLDGKSCARTADAWTHGWLVFANNDRDSAAKLGEDDDIVAYHIVSESVDVISNRLFFTFRNYAKRSTNGTLVFCTEGTPQGPTAVVISYTGRPRTARQRGDGKPYSCER